MVSSVFSSVINLSLPQTPSADLPDDLYSALLPIYNAIRILHQSASQYAGLGVLNPTIFTENGEAPVDTVQVQRMLAILVLASENIAANDFVNLHNSSGVRVRRAVASGIATRADGYAPVAIGIGSVGIVYLYLGYAPGGGGLAVATTYYLSSSSPGAITSVPPVASGTIRQEVGRSGSPSDFFMRIGTPFINP